MSGQRPSVLCAGCGEHDPRPGSRYCSEACRNATKTRAHRQRLILARVPGWDAEQEVVREIRAHRLDFLTGLLWMVDPAGERDRHLARQQERVAA